METPSLFNSFIFPTTLFSFDNAPSADLQFLVYKSPQLGTSKSTTFKQLNDSIGSHIVDLGQEAWEKTVGAL